MPSPNAPQAALPRIRRSESPDGGAHAGRASGAQRLLDAFLDFEAFPALRKSRDAMIAALNQAGSDRAELIRVVESDPALAIAVLRAAARKTPTRPAADIPTALALLSSPEIEGVASRVTVFDFFDQSRTWSHTAEQFRLHARATQAATEHVRRALGLRPRPDLLVAALLHDIGKLVLLRAYDRYQALWSMSASPCERRGLERQALGVDHTMVGGVLARRLGLPDSLVRTIEHHHDEAALGDAAVIRVADMLAHYGAGGAVDAATLASAGRAIGLSSEQLRSALDELPVGGRLAARPDTPSPLTPRETEMVQKLAAGKIYKQIAADFGLQVTTVRTHLYNTYRKLGVQDRAQAVLLATSRGWL